jgi:colanic acid/amylovoran biosynthesis glycosyltransferase
MPDPCVAYLINQYPKLSHAFIRREIQAVEACGLKVERFSIRTSGEEFRLAEDAAEARRTRVVLEEGFAALLLAAVTLSLERPRKFAGALALALRMGWRSDRGWMRHIAYVLEACVLVQWFRQARVDHVHAHFGSNPAAVAMLCHALGGPAYSFTAHGPDEFERAARLWLPEKIRRARFIVTVSSFGRNQLCRWCPEDQWGKIQVMHPGLDGQFLTAPPVPIGGEPLLVCIGRLEPQKGQLVLLKAVQRLIAEGTPCQLILIGDGPQRPAIESEIASLKLAPYVTLAGSVSSEELRRHVAASRAVVVPSFAENLPSVILEAFALGRPVIASCIAGIPELVGPSCGWLAPAGSQDHLVQAMRECLGAAPKVLEQMGQAGRDRVMDGYRSDAAAHKLAELFRIAAQS